MTAKTEILLCPEFNLGPDSGKVWVIETPVGAGDFVVHGDTILTIENELASLEVPSPSAGRVVQVLVSMGEQVTANSPIIEIEPMDNLFRDDLDSTRAAHGTAGSPQAQPNASSSVFLVHGHNEMLREMSARLMEKLGLDVIILSEQVSRGATIIEKLERYSQVQFAVVLMTADDVGAKKSDSLDLKGRARQNVILELGYFMGKIGRHRVCVLYEHGVELPSDYYGVVFIEIDSHGAWRYGLAKELKQVGLKVDLNKL